MHRDIKPANIVKKHKDKDNLEIKIVDMGFAKFKSPQRAEMDFCGSPEFMAPE